MPSSVLHYDITQKVGEGGMGIVYLAYDTKLKRNVALKFLPPHVARNQAERIRFEQEAQSVARLNHPNVTQIFAIEETDDDLFIVMEYVEGTELKDGIEEDKLSLEEKVHIARQIASGLRAAHEKQIVHRDIKSKNIMISEAGTVKVMDFGLARMQGSEHITNPGTTVGTTSYMSPEQLHGEEATIQSDIWSYGVVLYELFTGRLPFQGAYEPAIMYAIVEEDPLPMGEVPDNIQYVIQRCLEKEPADRYREMDDILQDISEGESKSGTMRSPFSPAWSSIPSPRRYRLTAALLIVLVLAGYLFWPPGKAESSAIPDKKFLAVLPIENVAESPELDPICIGLAEAFSFRLSEIEKYEDSYWVAPASELRKENINSVTQANKLFGVNLAVSSTLQQMSDSTQLMLELVDAEKMRVISTRKIMVPSDNLRLLEKRAIPALLAMLNISISPTIEETINEGETSKPKAYEVYLKGIASLNAINRPDHLERAIGLFKEATALDPSFALAHAGLGESYWKKYLDTQTIALVDSAENALNTAYDLNQDLAIIQTLLGNLKAGTGKQEEAITHYNRAIEIDPKYSAAYRGLASVYDSRNESKKALTTYKLAIQLKPDYWEGYKDLAIHYLRQANYSMAIQQFREVLELVPNNSIAYSNLGAAYLYDGQNNLARQMFEKSMALEKNPITANNLAYLYFSEGLYNEAASMYELAVDAYSDRYVLWGNLASAYELAGENEKSLRAYLNAIEKAKMQLEINPNDPEVLADLGAYYSDINDRENALDYLERAITLTPSDVRIRRRAVSTYEQLGMREQALKWVDSTMVIYVETQPELEDLSRDPAFLDIKSRLYEEKENL